MLQNYLTILNWCSTYGDTKLMKFSSKMHKNSCEVLSQKLVHLNHLVMMFKCVLEKSGKWFRSAKTRKMAAEECYFVKL